MYPVKIDHQQGGRPDPADILLAAQHEIRLAPIRLHMPGARCGDCLLYTSDAADE